MTKQHEENGSPAVSQQNRSAPATLSQGPLFLALFQKRIEGDDALLELARLRFKRARLGTELYASSPEELAWLLGFKPWPDAPVVMHLPREIDIFSEKGRNELLRFATSFAGQVHGFIVHDQADIVNRFDEYYKVLEEINAALSSLQKSPFLFIEYAAMLDPGIFCEFVERLKDLQRVSGCIDIGHLGIRQVREAYRKKRPNEDVCAITPTDPRLPELIGDIQNAADSALPIVLGVVRKLGSLGKPLHFHLHDGHPLSTFSPFGVSDHLSFFAKIWIPFLYKGKKSVPPIFGPSGLAKIVNETFTLLCPALVSFTLEIHPTDGRLPLGDASDLFNHWTNKTNAEQMNFWLSILLKNHRLLQEIYKNYLKKNT